MNKFHLYYALVLFIPLITICLVFLTQSELIGKIGFALTGTSGTLLIYEIGFGEFSKK